MLKEKHAPGHTFKPGETVYIYPSADLLAAQGVSHTTAGVVCSPAYDKATGLLRVRVESLNPGLWHMTLVSTADVCLETQRRRRTPMASNSVASYPMPL